MGRFDVHGLRRFSASTLFTTTTSGRPSAWVRAISDAARRFLFSLVLITAKSVLLKALRKTAASSESLTGTTFCDSRIRYDFCRTAQTGRSHPCDCRDGFLIFFRQPSFPLDSDLLLCVFLSVAVWLIFVLGLDLTVPIWPAFLELRG